MCICGCFACWVLGMISGSRPCACCSCGRASVRLQLVPIPSPASCRSPDGAMTPPLSTASSRPHQQAEPRPWYHLPEGGEEGGKKVHCVCESSMQWHGSEVETLVYSKENWALPRSIFPSAAYAMCVIHGSSPSKICVA